MSATILPLNDLSYDEPPWGDTQPEMLIIQHDWWVRYDGWTLVVPGDMMFDGASIPRLCWPVVGPPLRAAYRPGAAVHDAAYKACLRVLTPDNKDATQRVLTKTLADEMLYDFAVWRGTPRWRARMMWRAVDKFAGAAWEKHHGER